MFERIYRVGNVDGLNGTGIGLAFVHQASAGHGGTVSIESTVRLPLRPSALSEP